MILREHYSNIGHFFGENKFLYIGRSHDNWFDNLKYRTLVFKKNCIDVFFLLASYLNCSFRNYRNSFSTSKWSFELFFCKKNIPLSRRVGYVMDGSMGEWVSEWVSERCMYVTPIRLDLLWTANHISCCKGKWYVRNTRYV